MSHKSDNSGILSISLAAQFCNVTETTIRKWFDEDRFPGAFRLPPTLSERRIPAPSLIHFMSKRGIPIPSYLLRLGNIYRSIYGTPDFK